ncbi:hypothetical protein [Mycolicibacterium fallax]|uniref:Uncharacterized protein n=1 Tax=Mycolicibacterium fallax TaxID=1793 RepID=A0A1X1QZX9_MYCFA|nr:hypothetical protein [Mycolicibacterium fallax]ORU97250.1 hypothetical protein AWC04_18375 [Mycolicibacterium fallax]BBY97858.1 hypothetical protein MFAL_13250 [Mycolicibacterium fallax]
MNTQPHPERVARLLLTTPLPAGVDAAAVVQLVDAGASRRAVHAAVAELVAAAWASAGREAAAAQRPRDVKAAVERLRGIAQLELLLGLAPETDPEPDPAPDPEPVSEPAARSWEVA